MHICGVRTAGLAVSHGLASSLIVMVSFTWGIFVFHERVKSMAGALFSIFLMICGICGMSYFSAPPSSSKLVATEGSKDAPRAIFCIPSGCLSGRVLNYVEHQQQGGGYQVKSGQWHDAPPSASGEPRLKMLQSSESFSSYASAPCSTSSAASEVGQQMEVELASGNGSSLVWIGQEHGGGGSLRRHGSSLEEEEACDLRQVPLAVLSDNTNCDSENPAILSARNPLRPDSSTDLVDTGLGSPKAEKKKRRRGSSADDASAEEEDIKGMKRERKGGGAHAIVSGIAYHLNKRYGLDWTVRQTGLAVVACGAMWGGSILVPLHYAGEEAQGLGFVFSFAVGAVVVTALLWAFRYVYLYHVTGSPVAAYQSLPPFHFSVMALPGCSSGLLWSVGNMASMVSVAHLGEGVGYSMTQSAMLVSGLWAIFYLKEITSGAAIRGWLASACLTISGILLLSYNHMPPPMPVMLKG